VRLSFLPGTLLAVPTGGVILLSSDAAGRGWYVDPDPLDTSAFCSNRSAPTPSRPHQAPTPTTATTCTPSCSTNWATSKDHCRTIPALRVTFNHGRRSDLRRPGIAGINAGSSPDRHRPSGAAMPGAHEGLNAVRGLNVTLKAGIVRHESFEVAQFVDQDGVQVVAVVGVGAWCGLEGVGAERLEKRAWCPRGSGSTYQPRPAASDERK